MNITSVKEKVSVNSSINRATVLFEIILFKFQFRAIIEIGAMSLHMTSQRVEAGYSNVLLLSFGNQNLFGRVQRVSK